MIHKKELSCEIKVRTPGPVKCSVETEDIWKMFIKMSYEVAGWAHVSNISEE